MESELQREKRLPTSRKAKKRATVILSLFLALALWTGLAYAGYYFAAQKLNEIQKEVDGNIALIKEQVESNADDIEDSLLGIQREIASIEMELTIIQEDLALTGETLTGSDTTKQALQEQIQALNTQLSKLQQSIARLEDASK